MSLEERFWDLHNTQEEYGLEFPIQMGGEVSGIAEAWCKGVTWKDLCSMTSLDQGDLCKILRRTVELLQQIPNAYNVKDNVRDRAEQAIRLMDRFPVANTMDNDNYNPQSTKLSTSSNSGDNEENPKSFEEMVSSEISEEDMLLIENASKEVIVLDEEDEGDDNKEDENEVEEVTDEEPKRNPALTKSFKGFQNAFSPEQTVDELERLLNDLSTNTREKQVKGKAKDKTSRDKKVRTIEGVDKNYSDNKKSASGSKKKEGNTFEAEKSNSNNKKKRQ